MQQQGKFILFTLAEFAEWLKQKQVTRQICLVQNHHTYSPGYQDFKPGSHFMLLKNMEAYHMAPKPKGAGMAEIAQNLTIFPDGVIAICRDMDKAPAGIFGANSNGICIENIGNFDAGHDVMTEVQKDAIIRVNALLCLKFDLPVDTDHIVYHHWYDLDTGKRTNGTGNVKTCPGTAFFGGNTVLSAYANFLPLVQDAMIKVA
jgi:hypothetical protein